MTEKKEPKVVSFTSAAKFRGWLEKNSSLEEGIWLRIFKKDTGKKTITHAEALDEALCFGWIDGQGKSYENESWLVKFTPRRARSIWSKRNREKVSRLIEEGRMQRKGLEQIEAAKSDGRWTKAYDSPKNMEVPEDFLDELRKDKDAYAFFKTLNRANTYAIAWRLQTAKKSETRAKRMNALLDLMRDNKKLH